MPALISGLMSSKFIAHFSKKENKIERPALLAKLQKIIHLLYLLLQQVMAKRP